VIRAKQKYVEVKDTTPGASGMTWNVPASMLEMVP
jgi:hypothetical protein